MVSFGLKDVTKHVLDFPMGTPRGIGGVIMNRKSWDKLSPAHKRLMLKHMPTATARGTVDGFIKPGKRIRDLATKLGVKYYKAGNDFRDAMAAFVKKEPKVIPAILKKQGAKNADRIVADFLRNLRKWERISSERIKGSAAAFAAALKTEIYDKLDPDKL